MTRLTEIRERLQAAQTAPTGPLPPHRDSDCWLLPGKCVAASRELALFYSSAPGDVEFLLGELERKA